MNAAFQNAVSHHPSDFASRWAAIAPQEFQGISERRETRQRYFGDVVPVWRYSQKYSTWTTAAGKVWPILVLKLEENWHHANVTNVYRTEFENVGQIAKGRWVSILSKTTVPHHSSKGKRDVTRRVFQWSASKPLEQRQRTPSKATDTKEKAFVILERARHMLGKQRVRDARELLQLGAANYPEDEQITKLLRAISPGRVSRVGGSVPDRTKEMAWIRENGHKYRDQWVAIGGSELLACASSLRELVDAVKRLELEKESPLLQKIAP